MAKVLGFPEARPEPDWWYAALAGFTPEQRALIERTVAPPSEMVPLNPAEEAHAKQVIEHYLQRKRFRR